MFSIHQAGSPVLPGVVTVSPWPIIALFKGLRLEKYQLAITVASGQTQMCGGL